MSRWLPMLIALIAGLPTLSAQQIVDAVDVQTLMPEPNGVQAKATAVVDAKSGSITEIKIELPENGEYQGWCIRGQQGFIAVIMPVEDNR